MKRYTIKAYTNGGVLLGDINKNDIEGRIEFTEALNSGQGDMVLNVKYSQVYEERLTLTKILEVQEVDDENKTPSQTYTGIIEEVEYEYSREGEFLRVKLHGVFTALDDILFDNSGKVFTATGTPGTIVKNIIDYFNTQYGSIGVDMENLSGTLVRYTIDSIDTSGTSISIDFSYTSCLEAINKTLENTGFKWYIGADGVCYVQKTPTTNTHKFSFGVDIQKFSINTTKKDMVNKLYLARSGGSIGASPYQDATSQSTYKIKEKYVSDSTINNATTQDLKGNQRVLENKNGSQEIYMEINPTQAMAIKPGDTVATRNRQTNFELLEIVKIEKKELYFALYFGSIETLGDAIKKLV